MTTRTTRSQKDKRKAEAPVAADAPPKKLRIGKPGERAPRLYRPVWMCPICCETLGEDDGVIPCVLSKCLPTAHMFCMSCCEKMMGESKTDEFACPTCRREGNTFRPLSALVSEAHDPAAKKVLDAVQTATFKVNYMNRMDEAHSKAAQMDDPHADLVAQRVTVLTGLITNALEQKSLEAMPGGFKLGLREVPVFDREHVRLTHVQHLTFEAITFDKLASDLRRVARELQPHIDAIYVDTPYKVKMCKEQWVYNKERSYKSARYLLATVSRRKPDDKEKEKEKEK